MSNRNQELEIKYYVSNLNKIENRIMNLGATLVQPRIHELNLCFDTPEGDLAKNSLVLRLRKDRFIKLTYKGSGKLVEGVLSRKEIEISVSSFDETKDMLESLGYVVSYTYEKYRTSFDLDGVQISLDEMPYGSFVEIEGPEVGRIKRTSQEMELIWEARISQSYFNLIEVAFHTLGINFDDLTFNEFSDIEISPDLLGVKPADT